MSPHHLNTEAPQTCHWPAYQLYTNHMIQHIWTISCILEWTGVFKVLHYLVQILFVLQKLELFFGRPLLPDPGNPANGPLSRPDVSICTFSTKLHNHSPPAGGWGSPPSLCPFHHNNAFNIWRHFTQKQRIFVAVLGERVEVVVSEFIGSPIYLKIYPPVIHPESGAFYRWDKLQACWSNHSVF